MDDFYRNLKSSRAGNDRVGNSIEIPKPFFNIENKSLVLKNTPVPTERNTSLIQPTLSKESALPNTLLKLKNKTKHLINQTTGKHLVGKLSYPEINDENSKVWQLADLLIHKLRESVGDKKLFLAPIPYNYITATKEPQYYADIFKKHTAENTHFIDLLPDLQTGFDKHPDDYFLPICGHFTPRAHQVTAGIIGPALQQNLSLTTRDASPSKADKKGGYILGISCFYHDAAAALLKDGIIIAAAQEERFTRKKHDPNFPTHAIHYCLEEGKVNIHDLDGICFYDNPAMTTERVLHNAAILDESVVFWEMANKSLINKLRLPELLQKHFNYNGKVHQTEHHASHAASAYYPSPFNDAAVLIMDGVGEWACSTIAHGKGAELKIIKQQNYPHSLGLLYSAFTYYCGFKVNSGEYKLMGLAPYGKPIYTDLIKKQVVKIHEDGSILLNLDLFSFMKGEAMTNDKFASLFNSPRRENESQISQKEMDIAASIQAVTEEIVIIMAQHAQQLTGSKYLVLAGGVALNCVANGKLLKSNIFEDIWIQPASGDAGGAPGAALDYYYQKIHSAKEKVSNSTQHHAYLGPSFSDDEVESYLISNDLIFHRFDPKNREETIGNYLSQEKIIGYLDGRMEFGPRALGHRSIIGDPTHAEMQKKFNLKIKYRESFRPFAPIALEENLSDYFDIDRPSPFMLLVAPVNKSIRKKVDNIDHSEDMIEKVNQIRSELPSITHVDYSARLQSVNKDTNGNKSFYRLLQEAKKNSGYGVLINTSFNVRGEPIVCTPEDAYRCFMRTEMDILVLGNHYLLKEEQPAWTEDENWKKSFVLD
ncbi:MAG: carbamoyltransferase [Reichenbachiella sp.]